MTALVWILLALSGIGLWEVHFNMANPMGASTPLGDVTRIQNIPKPFDYKNELPPEVWDVGPIPDERGAIGVETNAGRVRLHQSHGKISNGSTIFKVYRSQQECDAIEFGEYTFAPAETRDNERVGEPQLYPFDLKKMQNCAFEPSNRTIILIPGFKTCGIPEWLLKIKDQWLRIERVNVIIVDWTHWSTSIKYINAVAGTHLVARQLVAFLYYMAELHNADFASSKFRNTLTFVGHSLGAHISGYAGKELRGMVNRITGLDPAGPLFDGQNITEHLYRTDARLVDIIHSNAGDSEGQTTSFFKALFNDWMWKRNNVDYDDVAGPDNRVVPSRNEDSQLFWGIGRDIGHIDYYANDGSLQPGCHEFKHFCDHTRATKIYEHLLRFEYSAKILISIIHKDDKNKTQVQPRHKMLAFRSNTYNNYRTGAALDSCASHLSRRLATPVDYNATSDPFVILRNCAIVLDVILPAEEFYNLHPEVAAHWQELENSERGLKAPHSYKASEADGTRALRYFFDTLSEEPFIGYQFLLKMHLNQNKDTDNDKLAKHCKLRVLSGNAGTKIAADVEINDTLHLFNDGDQFHGFAVPLSYVINYQEFFSTEYYEEIWGEDNTPLVSPEERNQLIIKRLERVFPTKLRVALYEKEPMTMPETTITTTTTTTEMPDDIPPFVFTEATSAPWWWQKPVRPPEKEEDECARNFVAMEVRAISFFNCNISSWYVPDSKTFSTNFVELKSADDEQRLIDNKPFPVNRRWRKLNLAHFLYGKINSRLAEYILMLSEPQKTDND